MNEESSESPQPSKPEYWKHAFDGHLVEFQALRNEIAQRSRFQHQYILLLVSVYGAICSFALSSRDRAVVATTAPVLTLALYLLWVHQGMVINSIAKYIRTRLAGPCSKWSGHEVLGWENHPESEFLTPKQEKVRRRTFLLAHFVFTVAMPFGACLIAIRGIAVGQFWRYTFAVAGVAVAFISFGLFLLWWCWFYKKNAAKGPAVDEAPSDP